jgi:hypothetical protein
LRLTRPLKLFRLVEQVAQTVEERQESLESYTSRQNSNAARRRPADGSSAPYKDDVKGGAGGGGGGVAQKGTLFGDGKRSLTCLSFVH